MFQNTKRWAAAIGACTLNLSRPGKGLPILLSIRPGQDPCYHVFIRRLIIRQFDIGTGSGVSRYMIGSCHSAVKSFIFPSHIIREILFLNKVELVTGIPENFGDLIQQIEAELFYSALKKMQFFGGHFIVRNGVWYKNPLLSPTEYNLQYIRIKKHLSAESMQRGVILIISRPDKPCGPHRSGAVPRLYRTG